MKLYRPLTLILILPLILLGACSGAPTEEPPPIEPTVAPAIAPTTAPTAASIPVISTAVISTAVVESTAPIPTVDQDAALSNRGPWFVFSTPDGLFATNPDGSGMTQFYFQTIDPPYSNRILAAPRGSHIAYLTGNGAVDTNLRINLFPWGSLITDLPLLSGQSEPGPDSLPTDPNEAWWAIVGMPSMAFSPDGRNLAFIGAIDGETADLYLYSLDSYQITQLTDGPAQGYQPTWSPDGEFIVHAGVNTFGSGAGYSMDKVWAARADDTEVITLYDPGDSSAEEFIGWADYQTFLVNSWDPSCESRTLRTFNINTKASRVLWPGYFRAVAYDPASAVAVVAVTSMETRCSPEKPVGIYLVPVYGSSSLKVVGDEASRLIWSPEAGLFLASTENGTIAIDPNGQFIDLDMPQGASAFPAVDPTSKDLAWYGPSLWIGPLLGSIDQPPRMIFDEPVYAASWDPSGQGLLFFADSGFYAARRPDFQPVLIAAGLNNHSRYSGWVMP